jgi:2-amino-4-hydroxy-6-hydroxymethyldihydropteridine diphosphokinase
MPRAFIGIGSNIAPEKNILEALRLLASSARIMSISTFYREPAIDRPSEPDFYNGVVAIDTDLPPMALKSKVLQKIEAALGRRRSADKYASRTIDLDLLVYADLVVSSKQLTLPDPDILSRAFVAVPLCEIAPELLLPGSGLPLCEVAERLSKESMQPLSEFTRTLQKEFPSPSGRGWRGSAG